MTINLDIIKRHDPRKDPKNYILGGLALVLGFILDFYLFPDDPLTMAYVPVMIMVGHLSHYLLTTIILSGTFAALIQIISNEEALSEIFLLRWGAYFLIAFVVRTLKKNNIKDQENIIALTTTLSSSIDARDPYTSLHSQNVAYYSSEIGHAMKLPKKECTHLFLGGLLHDFGKLSVPEVILNKNGRLTQEEYEQIKQHPQKGYDMLKHVSYFTKNSILDMVLSHHEKYDGTGYPHGLKGENIPFTARIMAVADAFDAMTSERVYRETSDLNSALNEIANGRGRQFDPMIADVFLDLIKKKKIKVRVLVETCE